MMHELGIEFVEDVGEAAFYGPKIDINAKNVYGKWIPFPGWPKISQSQ